MIQQEFFKKNKTYLIIGSIIVVIICLILLIISLNKYNASIEKISDIKMLWPRISQNQTIRYFKNQENPAFYEYNLISQKETPISPAFDTPDNVIWSPNLKRVLIYITYNKRNMERYGSPFIDYSTSDQTLMKWVFDFDSQKLSKLDNQIIIADWYSNDQIFYQYQDPEENRSIFISNFNGSNNQMVIEANLYIDEIVGAVDQTMYFLATPGEGIRNLYALNSQSPSLEILAEDIGSQAKLSNEPQNVKFLIESFNNDISTLYWQPKTKSQPTKIANDITVEQSIWIQENKVVFSIHTKKTDEFKIYDLSTKKIQKINFKSKSEIILDKFIAATDQKTLYFTSDDILYKLELK